LNIDSYAPDDNMITTLAYTLIFGKPLIMYSGILTFLLLMFTAAIGALRLKGISVVPFKWHPRLAIMTLVVAIIHGLFGLSIYFNF
jgi:hypothetical protein